MAINRYVIGNRTLYQVGDFPIKGKIRFELTITISHSTCLMERMGIEPTTRSLQKIFAPLVHAPPEDVRTMLSANFFGKAAIMNPVN